MSEELSPVACVDALQTVPNVQLDCALTHVEQGAAIFAHRRCGGGKLRCLSHPGEPVGVIDLKRHETDERLFADADQAGLALHDGERLSVVVVVDVPQSDTADGCGEPEITINEPWPRLMVGMIKADTPAVKRFVAP